jgi:hypothetical protein
VREVRDMPLWMPHLPDHVVLPGQVPMPYQQHWHSSICKNAAHMVARHLYAAHAHLYINTDCDNFWPTVYLDNIVSIFLNSQDKKGLMIKPAGNVDGGLTGRMAYRPEDFWRIGGYDELLSPSGGQDVQLKSWVYTQPKKAPGQRTTASKAMLYVGAASRTTSATPGCATIVVGARFATLTLLCWLPSAFLQTKSGTR